MVILQSSKLATKSKERIILVVYISSLALLFLNDHYFKFTFANFLTGKLSDLLGVTCLTLLIFTFFKPNKIIYFLSLFFIFLWWKSPYSSELINLWNNHTNLNISRVVDYSDLFVLMIIPLVFRIVEFDFFPKKGIPKTLLAAGSILILASSAGTHGRIKEYDFTSSKDVLRKSIIEFYQNNPNYVLPDSLSQYTKYYNFGNMDSDSVNFYFYIPSERHLKNTIFWVKMSGHTKDWYKNGTQLGFIGIRENDYSTLKTKDSLSRQERLKLTQSLERHVLDKLTLDNQ